MPVSDPAPSDARRGQAPVVAEEPVSPELMPEAPFSGWGLPGAWLPDPDPWREAEEAPVVGEPTTTIGGGGEPAAEGPAGEEPIAVSESPSPLDGVSPPGPASRPGTQPASSGTAEGQPAAVSEVPAQAAQDA
ncbi:hypothetical protein ACIA8K_16850 [Catenuloplanes sp. NPDC051500]|uniref:hypothetical protein n=1 Tax=Catenuloplanes sp. NPDC051500 TaxID=3363959 RepID=UPI003791C0DD